MGEAQKKAMYFLLYKLKSISAAPTHGSCWRAHHLEPPQQWCSLTSAWNGAEIVLLPKGGWGRLGGDRVGGLLEAGCRRKRAGGDVCIMDPMTQFEPLNNLHPEGVQKFYLLSRPWSYTGDYGPWVSYDGISHTFLFTDALGSYIFSYMQPVQPQCISSNFQP